MRGADLINPALPDELLDDVIRRVGSGGAKRDLDACALVCRRWRRLERASRRSARLAASGERADEVVRLVAERFTALTEVSVDERLTAAAAASGSAPRSYRSGTVRPSCPSSGCWGPPLAAAAAAPVRECEKMPRLVWASNCFWGEIWRVYRATYRGIGGTDSPMKTRILLILLM